MKNLLLILALLFVSNISLTLSIKEFMDMRDTTGYSEEIEIYFSGLMSGSLVMNSMAQDKFKDKIFCGPFERYDPQCHMALTLMYLKESGPKVAQAWKAELGRDFYQEEVGTAYGLMLLSTYFCENTFNEWKKNK